MKRDRHTATYLPYTYVDVASLRAWDHWETRRITSFAHSCRICPSVMSKEVIGILGVVALVGSVESERSERLERSERSVELEGSGVSLEGIISKSIASLLILSVNPEP